MRATTKFPFQAILTILLTAGLVPGCQEDQPTGPGRDIVKKKISSELLTDQLALERTSLNDWYAAHRNDAREKVIREKQEILTDTLAKEGRAAPEKSEAELPWSSIGYDYVDHALEVTVIPGKFRDEKIPGYFAKIREIVGSGINITISPGERIVDQDCKGRKEHCNPIEGGVEYGIEGRNNACTVGYRARRDGKRGFVSAGHCNGEDNKAKAVQPAQGKHFGKVTENKNHQGTTDCDCLFVEVTDKDWKMTNQIYALGHPVSAKDPDVGYKVVMSGKNSGQRGGEVKALNVNHGNPGGHVVKDLVRATYFSMQGDSGAPVTSEILDPVYLYGIHKGRSADNKYAYFTKQSTVVKIMNVKWEF